MGLSHPHAVPGAGAHAPFGLPVASQQVEHVHRFDLAGAAGVPVARRRFAIRAGQRGVLLTHALLNLPVHVTPKIWLVFLTHS
ncbi:hypothetical protein MICRO116_650010 [Micrococcus sp. 116]|nr:hypothetical protein MICRO116_650010 [Micrococcus sp. 116]